jgi:hypothetical protein
MAVLSVSDAELRRLEVLRDVDRGGLPVRAAAQLLGHSERQVWRLLKEFRAAGAAGLVSKKRGRPSNRRTAAAVRAAALWIVRQYDADFGPTPVQARGRLFAYFHAARAYLEAWGKPVAFYSDKHGVFRVNHPGALGGDGMTQFGRALHALNIDIICANSSPAKGRVERANKTLQDRLVKELRLTGAATLAEGNALLPAFMADYNARFAKPPANNKDLHRPLRNGDDLDDAFSWKEERTLSQALTVQYDKVMFILEPSEQAKAAIGKRVIVVDYPDGRLSIRYRGVELAYRTFDKIRQVSQAAIVENKQLGAALAFIRDQQLRREPELRSDRAPRRRDQHNPRLFKVG